MEHVDIGNPANDKDYGMATCIMCNGTGVDDDKNPCYNCMGTGEVQRDKEDWEDDKESYEEDMREDN